MSYRETSTTTSSTSLIQYGSPPGAPNRKIFAAGAFRRPACPGRFLRRQDAPQVGPGAPSRRRSSAVLRLRKAPASANSTSTRRCPACHSIILRPPAADGQPERVEPRAGTGKTPDVPGPRPRPRRFQRRRRPAPRPAGRPGRRGNQGESQGTVATRGWRARARAACNRPGAGDANGVGDDGVAQGGVGLAIAAGVDERFIHLGARRSLAHAARGRLPGAEGPCRRRPCCPRPPGQNDAGDAAGRHQKTRVRQAGSRTRPTKAVPAAPAWGMSPSCAPHPGGSGPCRRRGAGPVARQLVEKRWMGFPFRVG